MKKLIMKNKITLLITVLIIMFSQAEAQSQYELPKEFKQYKDARNETVRVDQDFDKDGINDLAIIASKINSDDNKNNYLFVFLSKTYSSNKSGYYFPVMYSNGYDLNFEKSVLILSCCSGLGRYCETYKFKYYTDLSNMRLIGYDEENYGNAMHEGAYSKSVNLLTNKLELKQSRYNEKKQDFETFNRKKIKVSIPLITLETIDQKTIDYLNNLGSNYFK